MRAARLSRTRTRPARQDLLAPDVLAVVEAGDGPRIPRVGRPARGAGARRLVLDGTAEVAALEALLAERGVA